VARHARVKGPRLGALSALLAVSVVLSALAVFGWYLSGGRLLAMTTPSMCPTVCVGSLVAVQPLEGGVHPGELVTFRPPGQSATFTHRVVKVEDNGSFTTQGDAEASPDPWLVPPSDVVGRVSFTLAGVGWWLRALPMVAAGTIVLLFARRAYRLRNRRTFERTFGVLIVAVPLIILRPLIRGELIENVADPHHRGWFKGLFVNTGLLPAHLSVAGGHPVPPLPPSRLTWLYGPKTASSVFGVRQWAALPTWAWVVVGALVLSPIIGFLLYRATRPVERESAGVRVADAMALAPLAVTSVSTGSEPVPFDVDAGEDARCDHAPVVTPVPGADPVPASAGGTPAAEPFDVMPPARYSTQDRWRHAGPEPRSVRRALASEHAPRRNGGRRPQPVPESSPPSHHRSRRREQWSVRWPD
jgi:signal peptidase I